jgi:putative SOS response-associated peptidase YedK
VCGRITQRLSAAELAEYFEAESLEIAPQPRFNLGPSQQAVVVVVEGGRRVLASYHWGLAGPWEGATPINARAETVAGSGLFRKAFRDYRCIVPADGFFEWQHASGGRQPFFVRRRDGAPMALAGLWLPTASPASRPTFTILTTRANSLVAALHDRMPVVLAPETWQTWLDQGMDRERLLRLLRPSPPAELESYAVSRRVNDVRNDGGRLIEPLEGVPVVLEQPGLFDGEASV